MNLAELFKEHPRGSFRHIDFPEGASLRVLSENDGFFWTLNKDGTHATIKPEFAEKGWSLHLLKHKEKWCAWMSVDDLHQGALVYRKANAKPDPKWIRVEQFDFEVDGYS